MNTAVAASALPLYASAKAGHGRWADGNELYEFRTYELKFASNTTLLMSYLRDTLAPGLTDLGVNHFMLFEELGKSDPKKIHALISYPSADIYVQAQQLTSQPGFLERAAAYNENDKPIYARFTSMLLLAFDGMAQMLDPIDGANLYELRIYEGYDEDAVRRKIKMFDDEEIALFHKVGLHPLFFGDMIAGPYRPSLVYMLNFTDMAQRDANWKTFIQHPEWDAMKNKPIYANTVSNIRRIFLTPI